LVTIVGLGGIGSLVVALAYENKYRKLVVLRPCKKSEVKGAKRVAPAAFKVTPSTEIGRKPALEGQLVAKDYEVYVICLGMPWPMVLESVGKIIEEPVVAGEVSCFFSPKPKRCLTSAIALAALGEREGTLVHALPGHFPADASCVAENIEKCLDCFQGVFTLASKRKEEMIRIVDYIFAKAPNATVIELRNSLVQGNLELIRFDLGCVYRKLDYLSKIRELGPRKFFNVKESCKGDLVEALRKLKPSHSPVTSVP